MTIPADEQLLQRLLQRADPAADEMPGNPAPGDHPSDETLAAFTEATLGQEEREAVIAHLADCDLCREIASQAIKSSDEEFKVSPVSPPTLDIRRFLGPVLAIAASLLMGFVVWRTIRPGDVTMASESEIYREGSKLLATGEFSQVSQLVAEAEQRGVASGRLKSLLLQADRRIPDPVALASAGRLSDFGYGIGGVVAMGAGDDAGSTDLRQAADELAKFGDDSVEVLLNRGHLLLDLGDADEALPLFERATKTYPENPFSWLGMGIASYMLTDYDTADSSFREALRLQPDLTEAKINRAMTFEELGGLNDAIQLWRELLEGPISENEKAQIRRNLAQLESMR